MPASAKKYKLFSQQQGGGSSKPVCAFFTSPGGCRNGASCKFLHTEPAKGSPDTASVISSESEGSVAPADQTKHQPSVAAASADIFAATPSFNNNNNNNKEINNNNGNNKNGEKQSKKKKKRRSEDNDIFASPKSSAATSSTPKKNDGDINTPSKKKIKTESTSTPEPEVPDFRSLVSNLPIASFSIPGVTPVPKNQTKVKTEEPEVPIVIDKRPSPPDTPAGEFWKKAVAKTQEHERFESTFDFDRQKEYETTNGLHATWIRAKPYGSWCKKNPVAIAIDCEMCETQDPVTKAKNSKALCRISIVNAEKPEEVLLDTLVKPEWPVSDYRTRINGISQENLENVEFTLKHAQAFMMALCSDKTVIVGQAVHNDLFSLRMEHYCVADSACLFQAKDAQGASVSLKDLVKALFKKDMPNTHDSVNDARKALECVQYWVEKDGKVDPIERSSKTYMQQLFIHRIPKICKEENLMMMFLKHTSIEPTDVEPIEFSGEFGKTHINFRSGKHASLAFETIDSKAEEDKSGRKQKKVYLRSGEYIRVREMAYPKRKSLTPTTTTPVKTEE